MYRETINSDEILDLPFGAFDGEIIVVDNEAQMADAYDYLATQKVLGYDTETRPSFKKGVTNTVALLQLSGDTRCYLFRLNKVLLSEDMIKIIENQNIKKIGAAIRDDLKAMRKLQKFMHAGFIDLQSIVGEYGIKDLSVRKIGAIVLNVRISKAQRLSNWEAQFLTESQQLYAATDAWACREIYLKLIESEKKR